MGDTPCSDCNCVGSHYGVLSPPPSKLKPRWDLQLAQGEFIEQGTNVLAFGLPGTGKTHALCALGHRLVETGYSVLFTPAYRLVQELLAAQRDLQLPRALRKLDNFDFLVLDDLGYLPQGAAESEVLFTLMAERYERRAIGITSNLVFSQWDALPHPNRYSTKVVASAKMLPKTREAATWAEASARWRSRNLWRQSGTGTDRHPRRTKGGSGRIHCDNRPPSQARHQAAGRHC